jgi:hypothetical protein
MSDYGKGVSDSLTAIDDTITFLVDEMECDMTQVERGRLQGTRDGLRWARAVVRTMCSDAESEDES